MICSINAHWTLHTFVKNEVSCIISIHPSAMPAYALLGGKLEPLAGRTVFMFGSANSHHYAITADFKIWSISPIRSANRRITGRQLESNAGDTCSHSEFKQRAVTCIFPCFLLLQRPPRTRLQHVHNYRCRQRARSCRGDGALRDFIPAHIWREVGKTLQTLPVRAETNKPFTLTFAHNIQA